jgi:indole-3-glycerol phosphate synthase
MNTPISSAFVRTDTVLDRILAEKVRALAAVTEADRRAMHRAALAAPPPRDFAGALALGDYVALIAEVKHASPSKGVLIEPFKPAALARVYAENGARCLSVLTDEAFFRGHLGHLGAARDAAGLPVLRKDFTLDAYAIDEARAAGADAILLIMAALHDEQAALLHAHAAGLGLAVLVEVHDEDEMRRAAAIGARLVGVNNRDLHTFREDLGTTARLAPLSPAGALLVGESAVRTTDDVRAMAAAGASAVLVGEGLVKAGAAGPGPADANAPETAAAIAAQVRAFASVARREGTVCP